jgi:N6-L-threonylcarbamoyladenine synthase
VSTTWLFAIHHIVLSRSDICPQQAHALTSLLTTPTAQLPTFPFLTLLISGGHTLLLLASSPTRFRILAGQDVDLSIGRAFDKTAKLLNVPWIDGGGPGAALERLAATAPEDDGADSLLPTRIPSPGRLALSFSGTFSLVGQAVDKMGGNTMTDVDKARLARDFQRATVAQLVEKTILAVRDCERRGDMVKHVVVSGGVASNSYLRAR